MANRRALHFVFKIGNRKETANFYRNVLGMQVLRHEEFEEGCKAFCNGPYDGKWSKTMIGYGAEDNHFVCELTYNYGIGEYKLGNDFLGISINSKTAVSNAKSHNWPHKLTDGVMEVEAPGGYKFFLSDYDASADPVQMVTLGCSNLTKSTDYWTTICGMKLLSQSDKSATFSYNDNQARLKLVDLGCEIDHKTAFGRIAISCPREQLSGIQKAQKDSGNKIVMDLVSLDTPGKATVEVVILADPDGHEICFVGDEAFRELSQVDPNGNKLLDEGIELDKSDEWYAKHNKTKASA